MGCARTLLSDAPMRVKMGLIRHLAGDQADSWAYHLDHWFPERYVHTLKTLGFDQVQTQSRSWAEPPYLSNVEVLAIKPSDCVADGKHRQPGRRADVASVAAAVA
jgi:hypothetical protein